jgi:hypothetical protein
VGKGSLLCNGKHTGPLGESSIYIIHVKEEKLEEKIKAIKNNHKNSILKF